MKHLLLLSLLVLQAVAQSQYQYPSDTRNPNQWTTNYGAPVPNNDESLTVGSRGPVLLEDYLLVEKLANFARERIPERVVHAVGAAAKGYFTVTNDVSKITMADFLQPGKTTPLIARFSTVIHSRGSPETLRDPRGFAVKFYTQQGNYDLVGNNFPVFFIRDAMKFPDMVHSLKPNPVNNQQEWWRIWDFFSHVPESTHMFTFLLDDIGIPKDYRHMDGFGVHTFKWINSSGFETLVKYHWKTRQGVESLVNDSQVAAITNHAHAQADLYNSIKAGDYPIWDLKVQTMDLNTVDINALGFDPLDVTKIWPENLFPLQSVGYMTLNETVSNFFHENEQLAFGPAIVVPGIYYSDDKLLQGRLFSYPDTQRHRLGGNYLMLPVNQPRCPYRVNMFDGAGNFMQRTKAVNYFPSVNDPATNAPAYPTRSDTLSGQAVRTVIAPENNFAQAGVLYNTWPADRKERFNQRLADSLSGNVISTATRDFWLNNVWNNVDPAISTRVRQILGI